MAKFETFYDLCPIPDPNDFLGIAADKDADNIITTLTRNIVVVLNLSLQKQIYSWSSFEKLSAKVVYDRRSAKYVGVLSNYAIRMWDEQTTDINKCKKLKFQKNIAMLVSGEDDTLVLYSDGTCELLAVALEARKHQDEQAPAGQIGLITHQIFTNPRICCLTGGSTFLFYFKSNHKSGDLTLVGVNLKSRKTKEYSFKRENVKISGYAVIDGEDDPMVLTIWSDSRIFLLSLADSVDPSHSPGNFVSMLTELNVETSISVLGISRHFVAIYGANLGQEGSSLLCYNTQFKVIKAKQFFKVYFNLSKLWVTKEYILLAMGQNLWAVTYSVSKEVLAALLGTQNNDETLKLIDFENINEEESLEQSITYVPGQFKYIASNIIEKEENIELGKIVPADNKHVPYESVADFNKTLDAISRFQLHAEVMEVDQGTENVELLLMSEFNDNGTENIPVQMFIRQMERCGASEYEISEKLITLLIKIDQPQQILICLRRYTNISEKILAKTLRYALQKHTETVLNKEENQQSMTANEIEIIEKHMDVDVTEPTSEYPNLDLLAPHYQKHNNNLLNTALACTFDTATIIEHIRSELEYKDVLLLLEHLYNILKDTDFLFDENSCFEPPGLRCEMQILNWLGVLLNAHYQKLALSKDSQLIELLYKWQAEMFAYIEEQDKLVTTAALITDLVQKRVLPKNQKYSKWYSIEEVDLY